MANILMSGAAGYIGSHTAYQFLKQTHDKIIIVDNLSTGFMENFEFLRKSFNERVEFIKADIGDISAMSEILQAYRPQAVVHFAASLIVSESVSKPLEYYINNTLKTTQFVNLCIKHHIKYFIFSSTAAVYGEPKGDLMPLKESAPLLPINPYGASKMMSERVLADSALAHSDFYYVALRYFNVAGASMDNSADSLAQGRGLGQRSKNATHLIKVACECACGKRAGMSIFGEDYPTEDGSCVRDYIHIDDLASAHLCALDYLTKSNQSQVFNVGYSRGASVKEVIRLVKDISGVDFKVQSAPRRAGDPAELWADNAKILSLTHWKPQFDDLRTIIQSAYSWEKSL